MNKKHDDNLGCRFSRLGKLKFLTVSEKLICCYTLSGRYTKIEKKLKVSFKSTSWYYKLRNGVGKNVVDTCKNPLSGRYTKIEKN